MTHPAAGPERGAIEPADVSLRSLVAVGAATRVDDVRIGGADVFDVELVLLTLRRHVVGEEDIGGLGYLVEHFLAARCRHVDPNTALPAIGMLHQRMPVRVELEAAHVDEA